MRSFLAVFGLVISIFLSPPSHAQDSPKELDAKFDEQLKKYDPVAVKAAKSYALSFNMRSQFEGMSEAMRPGMTQQLMAKNPSLKPEDLNIFFEEFFKVALIDSAPLIEKWTVLNMLDVLTTEEIIAADAFYSSPIGKSMMAKLPKLMARFPEMMGLMERTMIPAGLAAAQAKLKSMGRNIKI